MKRFLLPFLVVLCVATPFIPRASAQVASWKTDGVGLSYYYGYEFLNYVSTYYNGYYQINSNTNVTDDGSGGMITCWNDYSNDYHIKVQRVNSGGTVLWDVNYARTAFYNQNYNYLQTSTIKGDGRGGAYITFLAYNNNFGYWAPYLQYVDPNGNFPWGQYGVPLTRYESDGEYNSYCQQAYPYYVQMDKNGSGGVVIEFYERNGNNYYSAQYGTLWAVNLKQKNTSDGAPTLNWGGSAKAVFTGNGSEYMYYAAYYDGSSYYSQPDICSDGANGAFLAWQSYNSYYGYTIRVAHLDNNGTMTSFNSVGLQYSIYTGGGNASYYGTMPIHVMSDRNGGAVCVYQCAYYGAYYYNTIMAFHVVRNTNIDYYYSGMVNRELAWGPNIMSRYMYYQKGANVCPDSLGGFWYSAYDLYTDYQNVLRHSTVDGSINYDINLSYYSQYPSIVISNDGSGNGIVAWSSNDAYYPVYLQKYSRSSGSAMLGGSPVKITNNVLTQYSHYSSPQVANDGAGGALIAWDQYYDNTGYYMKAYGQRIADTASLPHGAISTKTYKNNTGIRVAPAGITGAASLTPTQGTPSAPVFTLNSVSGSQPAVQSALQITGWTSKLGNCNVTGFYNGTTPFASAGSLPITIPVGSKIGVVFTMKAFSNKSFTDSLIFTTNDPTHPTVAIGVTGFGLFPHFQGNDTLNMPSTVRSILYSRTYQINNVGTSDLNISKASITGVNADNFSLIGGTGGANPQNQNYAVNILAGASGTITVGFTPKSADIKLAVLSITTEDSASPKVIQMKGQGVFPHVTAANTVNFQNTVLNLRTKTNYWSVKNTGTSNLVITSMLAGNPEFKVDSPSTFPGTPITVAAGQTSFMRIRFSPVGVNPTNLGPRTTIMNVVSNYDSASPFPVTLTGTAVDGAPDMQCAAYLDAGSLHVTKKDTVNFHIANTTEATKPLIITSFGIIGQFAKDFAILSAPPVPVTIPIGGSIDLKLTFTANDVGEASAILNMQTSAGSYPVDIPLIGAGTKAHLTADLLDFGKVAMTTCKTLKLNITNTGTDVLNISSFTPIGANSLRYTYTGPTTLTLQIGEAKTIPVTFCPLARETDDIQFRFITSDGDTVLADVHGRGGAPGNIEGQNLNFKLVQINQTVTLREHFVNTGDIPVNVLAVDFQNTVAPVPFTTDVNLPTTIAPGGKLDFNVMFNSSTGGDKSADMVFTTDDTFGIKIKLTASATPDPFDARPRQLFSADTIAFGDGTQDFVNIVNFTKNARPIASLEITGPAADVAAYRLLYPISWPYEIAPQGGDSIMVGFFPTSAKPKTYLATLVIAMSSAPGDTVRISLDGTSKPAVDVKTGDPIPNVFALTQNYPNPFAGTTTFSYSIPERGDVALTIYDVMGREVRELINGAREAGVYTMDLSGETLAPGTYTYALRVNGITKSRLMQVVR